MFDRDLTFCLPSDCVFKELKNLRNSRWDEAFHSEANGDAESVDLKATIVIEHIIQANSSFRGLYVARLVHLYCLLTFLKLITII
jgi:hypothetical protein